MKIIFSDHARQRLKERQIPEKLVIKVVENSDELIESFRDRRLFRRRFGAKILEVVAVKEKSGYEVVTAYYLKEDE